MIYVVTAQGVPEVAQHAPTSTGQPDQNADFDCAEADCRAVAQQQFGFTDSQARVFLDLTVIRNKVLGYGNLGPTTPDKVQAFLASIGIKSTIYYQTDQQGYLWREWNYLDRGLPLILLCRWETPSATALHYRTCWQQTDQNVTVMDSWLTPAVNVTETHDLHWKMAQTAPLWPSGTLIGIDGVA